MASLMSIPLEVLLQITRNLTTPDYCKMRLTCKHIEQTLFNAFSKEFFTKRQFMLTEFSLQALVAISKSKFSSSLKHVIFGLERPSLNHFRDLGGDNLNDFARNNNLLQEYIGHNTLIHTGQDVDMLIEAFSNLGNLEIVGMRDFYSRSRYRDSPDIEWKSYGVSTFIEATGYRPDIAGHDTLSHANYASRMLLNLLRALGKAASFPKHFEVILRERSLPDQAFNLPPYVEPVIHDVLANLRTLYLDLNPESLEFDVEVNGRPIRCRSYLLRRFLAKVPQLEHLRLNFQSYGAGPPNPYAPKHETSNVLLWLSQKAPDIISPPPSNSQLLQTPPPVAFTQLRELDIGMTTTEPKILLSIVQKFKATLRVISLHRITLSETGSAAGKTRVNLWAKFFRDLAKLDPNFSEMNMSHLTQMQPGREHLRGIEFKGARDPKVRKWAANDTQSGLRDLAEETVVLGLDRDTESEGSTCESVYMSSDADEDGDDDSDMDED